MPPRSWRFRIQDILDAIAAIESYTTGMDYDAFASDRRTIDAVIRNIEVIGEAARHLPRTPGCARRACHGPTSPACATSSRTATSWLTCRSSGGQSVTTFPRSRRSYSRCWTSQARRVTIPSGCVERMRRPYE